MVMVDNVYDQLPCDSEPADDKHFIQASITDGRGNIQRQSIVQLKGKWDDAPYWDLVLQAINHIRQGQPADTDAESEVMDDLKAGFLPPKQITHQP